MDSKNIPGETHSNGNFQWTGRDPNALPRYGNSVLLSAQGAAMKSRVDSVAQMYSTKSAVTTTIAIIEREPAAAIISDSPGLVGIFAKSSIN